VTRVVSLTGGIGTGKSTVGRLLAALGAVVIDSDAVVREQQAPGTPLLAEIVAAFGREMLLPDGSLDRARLARLVFADPAARARLNALVHPVVGRETVRRLDAARAAGAALVVLDIPLLLEGRGRRAPGGGPRPSDGAEVIVVYAREEQQLERQLARDGVDREHALARIRAQLPIEEKRKLADHLIDNSGTPEATERQVRALYAKLTSG
jgi:dephospho-CoA kinase